MSRLSGQKAEDSGVSTLGVGTLLGHSQLIERLRSSASRVAARSSPVMIMGETGTGKEMLARFIHNQSPRASQPFIPVDCTAFSDSFFENQLFGHAPGVVEGAERESLGFIRAAHGGTLFLDEIGGLGIGLQDKISRFLQDRKVTPIGYSQGQPVDVRVVCATNRDLAGMVRDGAFRQDLYLQLQVFSLRLPPLRARPDDLIPLAEHCLMQLAEIGNGETKTLSEAALGALFRHAWPGNVRELFNVIEHAHVLSDGPVIEMQDLPVPLSTGEFRAHSLSEFNLNQVERRTIIEALKRCNYNRSAACQLLGLELRRLNRRVSSLKIEIPARRGPRRQGAGSSAIGVS